MRGRAKAEELGLPEYVLVPYETLTRQSQELHQLNTHYNTLRNDLFLAGEAVKQERDRVDHLIRKLSANLRYLLCERSELEQRQIMLRFGYSFRGDAPRANPEPTTPDPELEDPMDQPDNEQSVDGDNDPNDQEPTEPADKPGFEPDEPNPDFEPNFKPNEPGFETNESEFEPDRSASL